MGADQSSSATSNEDVRAAAQLFSHNEREQIQQIFYRISPFTKKVFKKYLENCMSCSLGGNLFEYITEVQRTINKEARNVEEGAFLVSVCHLLKGNLDESKNLILFLANAKPELHTNLESLHNFTVELIRSYELCLKEGNSDRSWEDLSSDERARDRVSRAVLSGVRCIHSNIVDENGIESWLSQNAFILRLLKLVGHTCFPVSYVGTAETASVWPQQKTLLPLNNTQLPNTPKKSDLLDLPTMLYLNHHLPEECNTQWQLLYSTSFHGQSFATMLKGIENKGPTLLVIKDTDGHIFGGFASESWRTCPQFIGTSRSFLFTCHPEIQVYSSTGYNENFMYLNHGQETLPNGLGMGGQFGFFGLWLDYDFGTGHSRAQPKSTTFGSPQLSASADFTIQTIEVWGVGPSPRPKPISDEEGKESILDKDPEAKAMLSLLDKGPVSEGLREADPTSDIPEEHSLRPL